MGNKHIICDINISYITVRVKYYDIGRNVVVLFTCEYRSHGRDYMRNLKLLRLY